MATLKLNGAGFNIETNSGLTEQEFVEKWKELVYLNEPEASRMQLIKEAHRLIQMHVISSPPQSPSDPDPIEREKEDKIDSGQTDTSTSTEPEPKGSQTKK